MEGSFFDTVRKSKHPEWWTLYTFWLGLCLGGIGGMVFVVNL